MTKSLRYIDTYFSMLRRVSKTPDEAENPPGSLPLENDLVISHDDWRGETIEMGGCQRSETIPAVLLRRLELPMRRSKENSAVIRLVDRCG